MDILRESSLFQSLTQESREKAREEGLEQGIEQGIGKALSKALSKALKAERKEVETALLQIFLMCWRFDLISARQIPYLLALPPLKICNASNRCSARRSRCPVLKHLGYVR